MINNIAWHVILDEYYTKHDRAHRDEGPGEVVGAGEGVSWTGPIAERPTGESGISHGGTAVLGTNGTSLSWGQ